jgi:3-hydroxy-D-aspartate aldolase
MLQPPPARPGQRESDVDTPALLIDMDAFEFNLDRMASIFAHTSAKLRPHAKTHKSPVIAHLQMARGAIGQCVQKVAEAEVLAEGNVPDILVSNEIVGASKLARFAAVARMTKIAVCVDDVKQIEALEVAASDAGINVRVLVETDAGGGRCGIAPGAPAADLARRIAASSHLIFAGLQSYHGSAQHIRSDADRAAAVAAEVTGVRSTLAELERIGLACPIVTGGGTGTFEHELASGVFTEIQAGSYCFMDADYGRNLNRAGRAESAFRQSLFVLSTVMSAARPGTAVVDAGHKSVSIDSGLPLVHARSGVRYVDASDEHGTLAYDADARPPLLGEKLRLVPGHCDPTVDRHDWYVCVRDGRVEAVWPVAARGGIF